MDLKLIFKMFFKVVIIMVLLFIIYVDDNLVINIGFDIY